jgi:hypothetical protein
VPFVDQTVCHAAKENRDRTTVRKVVLGAGAFKTARVQARNGHSAGRSKPIDMKLMLMVLVVGVLAAANMPDPDSPQKQTSQRLPGVELAERASQITGVAISPLLGLSSVGAWKYYRTPARDRHLLPWFCHPAVWGVGFSVIALCFLKDAFGAGAPPLLKKPLDVLELFENKLSGLIAAGAFVPLVALGIDTFNQPVPGASASGIQTGAVPFFAMIHLTPSIICVPFAIAAFFVIWLASHVINVLMVLSPFGFIDALLKISRTALLLLIPVTFLIHPYFALAICVLILFIACLVARWAFRLTFFGTVVALDLLPFRSFGEELFTSPIRAFTARRVGRVPARAYGRVESTEPGELKFTYRPWLIGSPQTITLPGETFALSKGLLWPVLLHKANAADRHRFLLFLLPRYRGHSAKLATQLAISEVRDGIILGRLKSAWKWLRETFGGREEILPQNEVESSRAAQ